MAAKTNTYRVLIGFKDANDNDKEYKAGDFYKPTKRISKERYDQLTSVNNALGRPVLVLVDGDGSEDEPKEETKETAAAAKK